MDNENLADEDKPRKGIEKLVDYASESFNHNSNALTTFIRSQMWTTISATKIYSAYLNFKRKPYFLSTNKILKSKEEEDTEPEGLRKFWIATGGLASTFLDIGTATLAIMHNYHYDPVSAEVGKASLEFWRWKGYAQLASATLLFPIQIGIERCKRIERRLY